jgi:hypothetical protein
VSLTNVWLATSADGLVRADQIIGIDAHLSPELAGKPSHWLLDVVLAVPAGGGHRDGWDVGALHRTVVQTDRSPGDAPVQLARLIAQLGAVGAAGLITAHPLGGPVVAGGAAPDGTTPAVEFRFTPFTGPVPDRPEPVDDSEYL